MKKILDSIVVAISGSDASIHAAKYGIVMAKKSGCKVIAVYVVDTASIKQLQMSKIFLPEESSSYEQNLAQNGEKYLDFVVRLGQEKGITIQRELRRGAIYTEILAAAEDYVADCILLGGWEEGRSSLDIINHAQKEILLKSSCSVLVVKEPDIDEIYDALK
jgi:nucleotide-binding universal stress UspA family protein